MERVENDKITSTKRKLWVRAEAPFVYSRQSFYGSNLTRINLMPSFGVSLRTDALP